LTTLLLCDEFGKSFLFTFLDSPGHPEFFDQTLSAINISDGVILVIDAAEGVLFGSEMALRHAILGGHKAVVIINGMDRLIIEFNEEPKIVHKKIIKILDEINSIVEESFGKRIKIDFCSLIFFNPIQNNVIFSSFLQKWSFSLDQYADIYLSSQPSICLSKKDLVVKFWNNFSIKKKKGLKHIFSPMFVEFVLNPLYNVIFLVLGESSLHIRNFFQNEIGIFGINFFELARTNHDILSYSIGLFLGGCREAKKIANHTGIISCLNNHFPISKKNKLFSFNRILKKNDLFAFVGKLFPSKKQGKFFALTKVINGTLKKKSTVCLLTEGHHLYFQENFYFSSTIKSIILPIGRYNLNAEKALNGSIVLITGIENFIRKSSLITGLKNQNFNREEFFPSVLKKISFSGILPVLKITVEPVFCQNLKTLFLAIRKSVRNYPALSCKIKSSGEFLLSGTGFLYLDCVLHDIQNVFGELDLKISQPTVNCRETICEMIKKKKRNKNFALSLYKDITFTIQKNKECLPETTCPSIYSKISKSFFHSNCTKNFLKKTKSHQALRAGFLSRQITKKTTLSTKESNSIWVFGPSPNTVGNCKLFVNQKNFVFSKEKKKILTEGFVLAVNQGPLFLEPLHEVNFHLHNKQSSYQDSLQALTFPSKIRRIFHWLLLKNKPTIQFPFFFCEIISPNFLYFSIVRLIRTLEKGELLSIKRFSSQNSLVIRIVLPATDALEFEAEIKTISQGTASCLFQFDSWQKKP